MSEGPWRRDDFGAEPLYFAPVSQGVVAGRRARDVAARAGLPLRLEPGAARARLLGTLAPQRSLYAGLSRVPPGHELEAAGAAWRVRRRWQPPLVGTNAEAELRSGADLLAALRAALRRVRARPAGSGRRGCAVALSGGLDSSALLALAAEDGPVRACTLVASFSDPTEHALAVALAGRLSAELVEVTIREDDLPAAFARAVRACDDVLWNGAAGAKLLFFEQLAAHGETDLLSGAGADEVLCGNPAGLRASPVRRGLERALAEPLVEPGAVEDRAQDPSVPAPGDSLLELQDAAVRETLSDSTLPPECRTADRVGVRTRLPFLDRGFAEMALRLPLGQRVRDGVGKWLLREATAGLLPDAIRLARKAPRLVPAVPGAPPSQQAWRGFEEDWLAGSRLHALGFVRPAAVRALQDRVRRGIADEAEREAASAVLLRLASLAILDAAVSTTRSASRPG